MSMKDVAAQMLLNYKGLTEEAKQELRFMIKMAVRSIYDLQKYRISLGNKIVIMFKRKLGMDLLKKQDDDSNKEEKKIMTQLLEQYKRLADALIVKKTEAGQILAQKESEMFPDTETYLEKIKWAKINTAIDSLVSEKKEESEKTGKLIPVISTDIEFTMMKSYVDTALMEERNFKNLHKLLMRFPIYSEFLDKVTGIGPAIGGMFVAEVDIHRADTVSKLYAMSGIDAAWDGRGRSRRKEHLVQREYTNKDGEQDTKNSITFNPDFKTKFLGVLPGLLIRAEANPKVINKSPYATIYVNELHRKQNHSFYKDLPLDKQEAISYLNQQIEMWKDIAAAKSLISKTEWEEAGSVGVCRMPIETWYASECERYLSLISVVTDGTKKSRKKDEAESKILEINRKKEYHRKRIAQRYMIKQLLKDCWFAYRLVEGLSVRPPYEEEKLGMTHHNQTAMEIFFERYPFMEKYRPKADAA